MTKTKIKKYTIQDGITQSLLAGWVNCRQYAKYMIEGWDTIGHKDALEFGNLWHWLLEQMYGAIAKKESLPELQLLLDAYEVINSHLPPEMLEKHFALTESLWPVYWKRYAKDLKRSWIAVEGVFDIEWEGFRLRGMRDGIYRLNKKLWLLETKTKGQINENTLSLTLGFDFQNLFYITAAESEGYKITGVAYNVIRRGQLKQKANESFPDYCDRMKEDTLARPDFYFFRPELPYSKKVKDLFKWELLSKLREFKEWVIFMDVPDYHVYTYKNESACVGRWTCKYLNACAAGGNMAGYIQTDGLFEELKK